MLQLKRSPLILTYHGTDEGGYACGQDRSWPAPLMNPPGTSGCASKRMPWF
jgi:hypothetical protein